MLPAIMRQECPDCARLWDDYVGARTDYAAVRREVDAARVAGDGVTAELLVARAKTIFDRKERSRAAMDEHEKQCHA